MNSQTIPIFTDVETQDLLPFDRLIPALRKAFSEGACVPERHHHTIEVDGEPEATLLLMPAWHANGRPCKSYLGVKIVTVFPGNSTRGLPGLTSTYMLYDGQTGAPLAVLDGNVVTVHRTVAASALAATYLARKDARKLLVVGAGRVASLIPAAYSAVRPIEEITIWDIDSKLAQRLATRLRGKDLNAVAVSDLELAVRNADIVSSATLATEPLISGAWLTPGTHVDLIGSFRPFMREADDDVVCGGSIYVDTSEALHEAGELAQPLKAGVITEKCIKATLSDLCRIDAPARISHDEITIYKAVGTALADLAAATLAFESASNDA